MTHLLRATLAVAIVAGIACSSAPPPVAFSDAWPSRAGDYDAVNERWTRSAKLTRDYDKILEVHATFKSPAWRAAYVSRRAKTEKMTRAAANELAAKERATASEVYEVELIVATYRFEEDDLSRGERSMWRVALVDDEGNELRPIEIVKDRRPFEVVRAYFPNHTQQHTPYVARFPRNVDLLGGGSRKFKLVVGSARGGVELVWRAK